MKKYFKVILKSYLRSIYIKKTHIISVIFNFVQQKMR